MTPREWQRFLDGGRFPVPSGIPAAGSGKYGWETSSGLPAGSLHHPASLSSHTQAITCVAHGQTSSPVKMVEVRPGPHLQGARLLFAFALLPWLGVIMGVQMFKWRNRADPVKVAAAEPARAVPQPGSCYGLSGQAMAGQFLPCRLRIGAAQWPL